MSSENKQVCYSHNKQVCDPLDLKQVYPDKNRDKEFQQVFNRFLPDNSLKSTAYLKEASTKDINSSLENLITNLYQQVPDITPITLYREVAKSISHQVPIEAFNKALESATSQDAETSRIGKQVFVFLAMKSILKAMESYHISQKDEEDAAQAAISHIIGDLPRLRELQYHPNIVMSCRRGVEKYISEKENISINWVRRAFVKSFVEITGDTNLDSFHNLKLDEQEELIDAIAYKRSLKVNLSSELSRFTYKIDHIKEVVADYFQARQVNLGERVFDIEDDYDLEEEVFSSFMREAVDRVLGLLPVKQRRVLQLRFGLGEEGEEYTLIQALKILRKEGLSDSTSYESVRAFEARILRNLRHPDFARELKDYLGKGREYEEKHTHPNANYQFNSLDFTVRSERIMDSALSNRIVLSLINEGITDVRALRWLISRVMLEDNKVLVTGYSHYQRIFDAFFKAVPSLTDIYLIKEYFGLMNPHG